MSYHKDKHVRSAKITRRQIIDINRAQKSIYKNTIKMNPRDVIRYDLNAIFDKDHIYYPNVHDISQIIFTTLFGTSKNVIYKYLVDNIMKTFITHRITPDIANEYNYRLKLIKKLSYVFTQVLIEKDSVKLNMNRVMYAMFYDRTYLYYYVEMIFSEMYDIVTDFKVNEKTSELQKNLYRDSIKYINDVRMNSEIFQILCDKIINKILSEKIKFIDHIPENIIKIIKFINENLTDKSIKDDNDGITIERNIIKRFNTHEHKRTFESVFKQNIYVLNDQNKCVTELGKKGEFDIVIGAKDKSQNIFKIRSIYDIKRSVKLIPSDIDKFNNVLKEKSLKLKDIDDKSPITETKKFNTFTKGYIYIHDFDTYNETTYKFRDILVEYISQNFRSRKFFTFICSQIFIDESNVPYLKFNKKFRKMFEDRITDYNEELYEKMKDFDIRKF
jgi:hypothetical protein